MISYLLTCALLVGIVNVQFAAFKRSTQNELLLARLADDAEREACGGGGGEEGEEEACLVAQTRAQKVIRVCAPWPSYPCPLALAPPCYTTP